MAREWSFDSGWAISQEAYYATASRDLPQQVRINGILRQHECFIEFGESLPEAEKKLKQSMEQFYA